MPKHINVQHLDEEHIYGIRVMLLGKEVMIHLHFREIPIDHSDQKWEMASCVSERLCVIFESVVQKPIEIHTSNLVTVVVRDFFRETPDLAMWTFERISLGGAKLDSESLIKLRRSLVA